MTKNEKVLVKSKITISDEERKKRSERMKALREKLKKIKNEKQQEEEQEEVEEVEEETQETPQQEEVEEAPQPLQEAQKPPQPKIKKPKNNVLPPHNTTNKNKNVKKKISIKYYGDVSEFEMMNDGEMLKNLHNQDYETDIRNKMLDVQMKREKEKNKFDEMRKMIYG